MAYMYPGLTQRGVPFVIQRAVGQLERPQEPPDLAVVPVEDGVDPHERRHPVAGTAAHTDVARFHAYMFSFRKQQHQQHLWWQDITFHLAVVGMVETCG